MKITESRFYRQYTILGMDNDERITLIDRNKILSSSQPYRTMLDDMLARLYLSGSNLVIQQSKLKDFEKCTDFWSVDYSAKKDKIFIDEECYFHKELEIFMITSSNLSNEYDTQIFEEGLLRVDFLYYENTNENVQKNVTTFFERYVEKYVSNEAKVSILLKTQNGIELKTHKIKPYRIDFDTMYNDDFLPVHQLVKKSITDESKGVVLFHGIAGSGKTNYIKWLTSQVPNKKFVFVPTTMISSLTDPSFIGTLIDNKDSVLILEDCENYIAERTALNSNTDVVSSLLNIADGILSDVVQCQLICTFNSDISKIDPALLRKGRLIAEYKFKELTPEKCNQYLKSQNKDFKVDRAYSLAEITNYETKLFKSEDKSKKIGF